MIMFTKTFYRNTKMTSGLEASWSWNERFRILVLVKLEIKHIELDILHSCCNTAKLEFNNQQNMLHYIFYISLIKWIMNFNI